MHDMVDSKTRPNITKTNDSIYNAKHFLFGETISHMLVSAKCNDNKKMKKKKNAFTHTHTP